VPINSGVDNVLLGEPGRTGGDIIFNLFGIPVRIHPFFWIITLLLGANKQGVPEILIWVAAVFVAILIHELGHALVIRAYGYRPWIVLYGMGGATMHDTAGNYRSRANTPLGQISISFAGPAAGFLLAGVLLAALLLAGYGEQIYFVWYLHILPYWLEYTRLAELVNDIFFVSVFWGLINLLPIYPLDGGQIVREILLYMNPQEGIRQSLMLSILTAGLIAAFGLIKMQSFFMCLMFAFLAYESFTALQAYSQGGR
jgi:stage IV sporulation protein FB